MREKIATIVTFAGFIGSFVLAVYWAYWIWQLDWGGSPRTRALMFMAMVFGAIIVFLVGYFATFYASDAIDEDR
jgi:O-antigen/teichoic acid export membrane protein